MAGELHKDVRGMLVVRINESDVQIGFDPENAWKSPEFQDFHERGIPAKEVFAAIERVLRKPPG
jgi:hypothetical protein